ncbi:hypothetical protein KBA27_03060 [bacterium]|nr:hypothetical protein [bacterium]
MVSNYYATVNAPFSQVNPDTSQVSNSTSMQAEDTQASAQAPVQSMPAIDTCFGFTGQSPVSSPFTGSIFPFMPYNPFGFNSMMPQSDFMTQLMLMSMMSPMSSGFSGMPNFSFNTNTNLPQLKNVYNPQVGKNLAEVAYENASAQNTRGRCFHGVRTTLELAGLSNGEIRGKAAYQAADMLENHKNFKEVNVDRSQLNNLPAGCVVVYNQCPGHPYGHITVSLGDGKAASDHFENAVAGHSQLYDQYRVFVPVGKHKSFDSKC